MVMLRRIWKMRSRVKMRHEKQETAKKADMVRMIIFRLRNSRRGSGAHAAQEQQHEEQ
jgi:hypothetical protein